jgi:hypothetical protein
VRKSAIVSKAAPTFVSVEMAWLPCIFTTEIVGLVIVGRQWPRANEEFSKSLGKEWVGKEWVGTCLAPPVEAIARSIATDTGRSDAMRSLKSWEGDG